MKITEQLLTQWGACSDGKRTFTQKFPEGAEYKEVIAACDEDGHRDYRTWIFNHAFQHLVASEIVEAETDLVPKEIEKGLEPLQLLDSTETKNTDTISKEASSRLAASGFNSRLAASGRYSQLAASGDDSRLAASGFNSRLAASGRYSQLAASGRYSQLAASGDDSRLAASGFNSRLAASGENSVIASSGLDSTFQIGKGGCAAIAYQDEQEKIRFAVAYEGENVKANTWYKVNAKGEFVEVETQS
ncbi:hypothetical protein [Acinetobacter baumannii]|uniref:hypothetical protein n=1 Tax=Acinetobacter baumannii TaxID=470 RepID=UPI000B5478FB|nr:hypothetical protein [Acinetobacter baumannii]MBU0414722.1 hypothetical protein [Acinetobacter baumannii]MBU0419414.1 hypothetical protein [Acinetobacter baumannii]MBZ0460253.1 hypothetical protein [Acinetobacter baumannii]OWX22630.1 hypothetical protein A7A41_14505 [Acinetobacter baumannii]